MSKRTQTSSARNWWPTPPDAVTPLLAVLPPQTRFVEPCAGDGILARTLQQAGHLCMDAYDLEPRGPGVRLADALLTPLTCQAITNPPFERPLLVPLLEAWVRANALWLLLPLDHLANRWFGPYAPHVRRIVPVGRVSWLGNGKGGMDNHAWVLFHPTPDPAPILMPRYKDPFA